jgi:hypothetical protein
MKKVIAAGLIAGTISFGSSALAHDPTAVNDTYDDAIMHPLRLAYHLIHPLGFAAEWLVGRPFQYIVSREGLRNVFGSEPLDDDTTYQRMSGAK